MGKAAEILVRQFSLFANVGAAAVTAAAGSRLAFGVRTLGARAYLAVAGGLEVPAVFGSRATHLLSAMGPLDGRPLTAGVRLPVASHAVGASIAALAPQS